MPYIIIPELDNAKILIDTGASDSFIDPSLANLYFQEYFVYHPFSLKTMHGTTYHNFIAVTPSLISFNSKGKDFRWNVVKFSDKYDGLIGSSMLNKLHAKIDYQNHMLQLPKVNIPFFFENKVKQFTQLNQNHSDILIQNIRYKVHDEHLDEKS